tara:strand:+ start:69 stop:674 length:606 start_codon:yes stop_codon:yes gene_type:complete
MNFSNKLPTRQILVILLPGFYLILFLADLYSRLFPNGDFINFSSQFTVLLTTILSLSVGILVYIADIPKKIWFFKSKLPTTRIKKDFQLSPNLSSIYNSYFKYYDGLSQAQRVKTDELTTLFHVCINLVVVSIITLIITMCFDIKKCVPPIFYCISIILLILNVLGSLGVFFGKGRVSELFERQYQGFKKSEDFAKLKNES